MKDSDCATWVFLARSDRLEAGLFNWKSNPWRHKVITLSIAFSFKLFLKCLERPWFNIRMVKLISRNVVFRSQKVIQIHFFFFLAADNFFQWRNRPKRKLFPFYLSCHGLIIFNTAHFVFRFFYFVSFFAFF